MRRPFMVPHVAEPAQLQAGLALLQASMVAVSSDIRSVVNGNPAEKRISILRPGTARRFFARLRIDNSIVRAP